MNDVNKLTLAQGFMIGSIIAIAIMLTAAIDYINFISGPCTDQGNVGTVWENYNNGMIEEVDIEEADHLASLDVDPNTGDIYSIGTAIPLRGSARITYTLGITKHSIAGELDQAFAGNGIFARSGMQNMPGTPPDPTTYFGVDGVVDQNRKYVFLLDRPSDRLPVQPFNQAKEVWRVNSQGDKDPSLGLIRFSWPEGSFERGGVIAVDQQNNILVAGHNEEGCWVVRFNGSNGDLDQTFGNLTSPSSRGYCKINLPMAFVTDIVVEESGKILIAGTGENFFVARITTAGELDNSFGNGGLIQLAHASPRLPANTYQQIFFGEKVSIGIQQNGSYLVSAGRTIERYTNNGVLDNSFGNNGFIYIEQIVPRLSARLPVFIEDILITPNDNIITAGVPENVNEAYVWCFDKDGNVFTDFAQNGVLHIPLLNRVSSMKYLPFSSSPAFGNAFFGNISNRKMIIGGKTLRMVGVSDPAIHYDYATVAVCGLPK